MLRIRKIKHVGFLLAIALIFGACGSDNDGVSTNVAPVANFTVAVSENNSGEITVTNTTQSEQAFTSTWFFGLGNGPSVDDSNSITINYNEPGEYVISLTANNTAGTSTATEAISILDINNPDCDQNTLKCAAITFKIGAAVRASRLDEGYDDILSSDFSQITSEFEMKMNIMYPTQGAYNFSAADATVAYAQANDMEVHGHALIWHNATPSWVENFNGTDAEFEDMVKDYITTTIQRYGTTVRSWDVVNEAIEDGSNQLRNSVFRQRMGDDFIRKCYQFARNADPNILLFYNDYNLTFDSGKQAAMFNIVDDLMANNLVDGVGAQMHISYNGPSSTQIQSVVNGTVSRGLLMHFSEIDIRANPDGEQTSLTNNRAEAQKAKYKEVTEIYDAIPQASKFALTVWGIKDDESWLIDFWGQIDWPLLYNADFSPKPAYQGVLEGLQ